MRRLPAIVLVLSSYASLYAGQWWPQFRGPNGDGTAAGSSIPTEFGEDENVVWKTELPGRGWSSPVVADGVIWVTAASVNAASEEELAAARQEIADRSTQSAGLSTLLVAANSIELKLISIDSDTGEILRTINLDTVPRPEAIHPLNTYASPTPIIDGRFIYCHFGGNGTYCVERESGDIRWRRVLPVVLNVGAGSSPLVYRDLLVLIQDGVERQYVVALDKMSGETRWETDRPEMVGPDVDMHKAFSTPVLVKDRRGREQLICLSAQWIISYNPVNGEEIWRCNHGEGYSMAARPIAAEGVVFFSAGYSTTGLCAIRIDGDGDVTDTHIKWTVKKGVPVKPSPVIDQGLIYMIDDGGVATCVDSSDGEIVWQKRIGGEYSASIVLAGDHLIYSAHDGRITVVRSGRKYKLVSKNQLDGRILATPAVVGDAMIVRTDLALYRIE